MNAERAALQAEHRAQVASADAWFANQQMEYAITAGGGTRYHLVTCRIIQSAVRDADRGESRYPVRLSMEEINARNMKPCGVCHGHDPLEGNWP